MTVSCTALAVRIIWLFVGLLIAHAATAQEATVDVGGKAIKLVPPAGYCALDPSHTIDRQILEQVTAGLAGQNALLMQSADCSELREMRAGRRGNFDNFSQVQVSLKTQVNDIAGKEPTVIKSICAQASMQGAQITETAMVNARQRVASVMQTMRLGESKFVGVLGEDMNGCYAAILQGVKISETKAIQLLVVIANVPLNGRLIYIYRFTNALQSVDKVLAEVKVLSAANVTANGGHGVKN
jgi:hypothetical protein